MSIHSSIVLELTRLRLRYPYGSELANTLTNLTQCLKDQGLLTAPLSTSPQLADLIQKLASWPITCKKLQQLIHAGYNPSMRADTYIDEEIEVSGNPLIGYQGHLLLDTSTPPQIAVLNFMASIALAHRVNLGGKITPPASRNPDDICQVETYPDTIDLIAKCFTKGLSYPSLRLEMRPSPDSYYGENFQEECARGLKRAFDNEHCGLISSLGIHHPDINKLMLDHRWAQDISAIYRALADDDKFLFLFEIEMSGYFRTVKAEGFQLQEARQRLKSVFKNLSASLHDNITQLSENRLHRKAAEALYHQIIQRSGEAHLAENIQLMARMKISLLQPGNQTNWQEMAALATRMSHSPNTRKLLLSAIAVFLATSALIATAGMATGFLPLIVLTQQVLLPTVAASAIAEVVSLRLFHQACKPQPAEAIKQFTDACQPRR